MADHGIATYLDHRLTTYLDDRPTNYLDHRFTTYLDRKFTTYLDQRLVTLFRRLSFTFASRSLPPTFYPHMIPEPTPSPPA